MQLHKYLRAIGFPELPKRKDIYGIIEEGIRTPHYHAYTASDEDENGLMAQYDIEAGDGFGISVCGQFDEGDQFFPEYAFPYLDADLVSSTEAVTVDRRVDNNSYVGICDDLRVGVTTIFRVRNTVEYVRNSQVSFAPVDHVSVSLSALSLEASVLLPIYITPQEAEQKKNSDRQKRKVMNAARDGDEDAIRQLAASDMNTYLNIMTHIQYEDVFTIVDSYFMPTGAECELYSVLGTIRDVRSAENRFTKEEIYILRVDCNGLQFMVGINKKDLYGDPQPGRRFKGYIWLMGKINFPTDVFAGDAANDAPGTDDSEDKQESSDNGQDQNKPEGGDTDTAQDDTPKPDQDS